MSTEYVIKQGRQRMTRKRFVALAKLHGWTIEDNAAMLATVVKTSSGHCVHFESAAPRGFFRCFTRYGGNDPTEVIEALEKDGWTVLSEHDRGFWS
jgi:hypothetical protein